MEWSSRAFSRDVDEFSRGFIVEVSESSPYPQSIVPSFLPAHRVNAREILVVFASIDIRIDYRR